MSSSSPQNSLAPWIFSIVGVAALAVGLTCRRFASGTLDDQAEMEVTVTELVQLDDFEQVLAKMFVSLGRPAEDGESDRVLVVIQEFEDGLSLFSERTVHENAHAETAHALEVMQATQQFRGQGGGVYEAKVQEAGELLWDGVQGLATVVRREARDISQRLATRWSQVMTILLTISGAALVSLAIAWRFLGSRAQLEVAEKDLANIQDRLSLLINNTPIVLWAIDPKGLVTLSEGAALGRLGVEPGQLVGQSVFDLYAERPDILDHHRKALEGDTVRYSTEVNGAYFQSVISPIRSDSGEVIGAAGAGTDVTELEAANDAIRRHELERFQTQKAESVGRLAGGMAHEFSNLLTVVTGFAGLLRESLPEDSEEHADVEEILNAGHRAHDLVQHLLAFSHRRSVSPRVLDLNEIVRDSRKMLTPLFGEVVVIELYVPDEPTPVYLDPDLFRQAILNLALNAKDAMPEGGTFVLEVTPATGSDVESAGLAQPCSVLRVVDSGQGMTPEVLDQAFEPFFTTKPPQGGTGLGLPTVQGILRQSGGEVLLQSELGQGTEFRLVLPTRAASEIEPEADSPGGRLTEGTGVILLAEDETVVRNYAARVLRTAGYRVLEAENGEHALEVSQEHEGEIDLLVTDVIMPRMNGRELKKRFEHTRPRTPVVLMSGYPLEPDLDFLTKPFSPADLCKVVAEQLEA